MLALIFRNSKALAESWSTYGTVIKKRKVSCAFRIDSVT